MSLSSRQTLLLQQLGITPYSLAHPERLHGEYLFKLEASTRLLIVNGDNIAPNLRLLKDLLLALNISATEYQMIPEAQFDARNITHYCAIWSVGCTLKQTQHLPYPLIISPSLSELAINAKQKCHLWSQISQYADYFNTST